MSNNEVHVFEISFNLQQIQKIEQTYLQYGMVVPCISLTIL